MLAAQGFDENAAPWAGVELRGCCNAIMYPFWEEARCVVSLCVLSYALMKASTDFEILISNTNAARVPCVGDLCATRSGMIVCLHPRRSAFEDRVASPPCGLCAAQLLECFMLVQKGAFPSCRHVAFGRRPYVLEVNWIQQD